MGDITLKIMIRYVVLLSLIVSFTACGGGGGAGDPASEAKTTALLTIGLTGTLPSSTAMSGVSFLLTLPAGVTPAITNGTVSSGVVILTGVLAGSSIPAQVIYTAASGNSSGTLKVILATSLTSGVTASGEVAKINLLLANGVQPTATGFGISEDNVIDSLTYDAIIGMGVSVSGVTLQ